MPILHIGLLFFAFDNLLFLLTAFLVGRFKILQGQMKNICGSLNLSNEENRKEISDKLKELVEHHESLTIYVSRMEDIFSIFLFCQLLTSAILICVAGFQVFMVSECCTK